MSTNRKPAFLVALAGLVAVAAVAASTAAARSDADVTLRLLVTTTQQPAYEVLIKNFNRVYPSIHIEPQYLPSDQLSVALVTQLQAGNAPDMFHLSLGNSQANGVWALASAGRLLDVTASPWNKRIYAPTKKLVSYKSRVYAWPMTVTPWGVIYNVDLFKQLGLKAPTTFAQALALCSKVNAAGKIPFVQAFGAVTSGNIISKQRFAQYVYSVDPKWNDKRYAKQVTFSSSPLWRKALQSVVDMKNANCFQPGSQGTSRAQQYAIFARGEAVMSIVASSEIANMEVANPNLKWGMFNLPGDEPKNARVLTTGVVTLAGNAATQHPAEVKTFINFMAREQQSTLFAKVSNGLAPLDATKGKLPATMKELLPFFKAGKLVEAEEAEWPNTRIFIEGLAQGIIGLITGQSTVDSVLAKMDQLWDAG